MKYKYQSLLLRTKIFLLIIFITGFSHLSGSKGVVKQQTKQECTAVGGRLTNFNGLQERHLQQEILSQLQHGESAWIEGFAKFSPFLAWHGCVTSLKDFPYVTIHSLDTPNLYTCVQKCAQRKMKETYMGIELTICFCFTNKISEANFKSVNSIFCSTPCSTASVGMCGGTNFTSLYRIVDNIAWAENEPSPRQCVNVIERQERFSASTSSCFTLPLPEYICTHQLSSKLNSSLCYNSGYSEKFCLVRKRSTRQEAFHGCLDRNGTLIEYYGEAYSLSLMQAGARYWLSVFRTFKPSKRNNTNGMGCLSVTKISDNLYLDPDSCLTQKPHLCQVSNSRATTLSKSKNTGYALYKSTRPVEIPAKDSKYRVDLDTVTKPPPPSFTILHTTNQININSTLPKQMSSNRNENESQLIYFILSGSFAFIIFVVSAVCLVVCMRKRKQQLQQHKKGHSASTVSENITVSFSRNYQNVDRNASNTVTETEGLGSESQEDQYDRIHSTELKTEDCHQINQHDHTATGATNSYINVDHTSFIHTEGRSSNSFPLFDSNKIAVSDHRIQAPDSREQDEDIYAMYLHAMSE